MPDGGPRILLCTRGARPSCAAGGTELGWRKGDAVWLAASRHRRHGRAAHRRRHAAVPRRVTVSCPLIVRAGGSSVGLRVRACPRVGERARFSRRWRPTQASRSRSSSASWSPARRRCWRRRCTRWPTPPTRACCCSGASGPSAPPPPEHPFGYGRDRFFYSFVVALLLFTLGSVFALYEGIEKLAAPRGADVADRRDHHPARGDRAWRASRSAPRSTSRASSRARCPGGSSSASPPRRSCRSCCWRTSAR